VAPRVVAPLREERLDLGDLVLVGPERLLDLVGVRVEDLQLLRELVRPAAGGADRVLEGRALTVRSTGEPALQELDLRLGKRLVRERLPPQRFERGDGAAAPDFRGCCRRVLDEDDSRVSVLVLDDLVLLVLSLLLLELTPVLDLLAQLVHGHALAEQAGAELARDGLDRASGRVLRRAGELPRRDRLDRPPWGRHAGGRARHRVRIEPEPGRVHTAVAATVGCLAGGAVAAGRRR